MRLVFSALAQQDLRGIAAHIRSENPTAAKRVIKHIRRVCLQVIGKFPTVGEACEHLRANLRRFTVEQYVIYFHPSPCEVLRVFHGAQDHERLV